MEWATAHRIAVYLETLFTDWDIDCEYNKMTDNYDPKTNSEEKRKRPDIVIHKRGQIEKENNLLVIEIKMNNDLDKLIDFTSNPTGNRNFQYQYGLKISFNSTNLNWFSNGIEIDEDQL